MYEKDIVFGIVLSCSVFCALTVVLVLFYLYYQKNKNKFIKGYYRSPESAKNYFCWIPFNKIEEDINYAFYKNEMTFKDYAWLYNSDNQNKLIDYALELCDEIIKSIKDSTIDPSVVCMV